MPNWDETLLVVTSDHGSNLTPPDLGRMRITDANREEAFRVPLFVKAPGQTSGEVRDDSAQMIDVLPSIVDLLDADVDWDFDGHSLFDGTAPTVEPQVSTDVAAALDIAVRRSEEFPYGDDWIGLAAVGANGDLVGRDVAEFTVGADERLHGDDRPARPVRRPADRRRRDAVRRLRHGRRAATSHPSCWSPSTAGSPA